MKAFKPILITVISGGLITAAVLLSYGRPSTKRKIMDDSKSERKIPVVTYYIIKPTHIGTATGK